MSDLISRSELIKFFKKHIRTAKDFREIIINIIPTIENQPTAYDIDKVVKELEEMKTIKGSMKTETCRKWDYGTVDKAIEIVKQGGVSDDTDNVCKWYKVNGNACKCYTHAEIYDSRVLDWCVCPYCRKKIKIVGD